MKGFTRSRHCVCVCVCVCVGQTAMKRTGQVRAWGSHAEERGGRGDSKLTPDSREEEEVPSPSHTAPARRKA